MKKMKLLMIIAILTTALIGCDKSTASGLKQPKENIISSVQNFSERENTILSTAAETALVFDFQLTDSYKELKVWVDKYQFGKLIDDSLGLSDMNAIQGNGTIVFTAPRGVGDDKSFTYQIGIGSKGESISTVRADDDQSKDDHLSKMDRVSGSLEDEKSIPDNQDFLLGYIAFSSDDSGMHSLSSELFDKLGSEQEELQDYDRAYLIKARFIR